MTDRMDTGLAVLVRHGARQAEIWESGLKVEDVRELYAHPWKIDKTASAYLDGIDVGTSENIFLRGGQVLEFVAGAKGGLQEYRRLKKLCKLNDLPINGKMADLRVRLAKDTKIERKTATIEVWEEQDEEQIEREELGRYVEALPLGELAHRYPFDATLEIRDGEIVILRSISDTRGRRTSRLLQRVKDHAIIGVPVANILLRYQEIIRGGHKPYLDGRSPTRNDKPVVGSTLKVVVDPKTEARFCPAHHYTA